MQGTQFERANKEELQTLFDYLQVCLEQVVKDNELGALTDALKGSYTEPGPGGDPIRNPMVLPTGKNIHALDPQSIPTAAAVKSAKLVVERWAPQLLRCHLPHHLQACSVEPAETVRMTMQSLS